YCMALMQNVRLEEQKEIGNQVNLLQLAPLRDEVKVAALTLALMNIVGDDVLRHAVKNLKPAIAWISPETVGRIMARVDFARARTALVEYCLALARDVGEARKATLKREIETIDAATFGNGVKASLLGIALIDVVGENVLEAATKALAPEITCAPPAAPNNPAPDANTTANDPNRDDTG
ncbi:MAG: hypothetical protein K8S25_15055, partial [Alphaproteobacteria bacterium]|nr:hypothetical protein [Alphaproteobacteria bacterium]